MAEKTAKTILEEITEARKHVEPVTMIIDGAQAHFIIESMAEALQVTALSFLSALRQAENEWDDEYGTQSEVLEASRELGLTAISTIKTFVEALPDDINLVKVQLKSLVKIEEIFREN